MAPRELLADVAAAGTAGAVLSGIPSTLHALATHQDPRDGARAAGRIVLPPRAEDASLARRRHTRPPRTLLRLAAVLAIALPRGRERAAAVPAGLAIAALDLGLIGRRIPSIRRLAPLPQWADHVAYGAAVGWALSARRARSAPPSPAART